MNLSHNFIKQRGKEGVLAISSAVLSVMILITECGSSDSFKNGQVYTDYKTTSSANSTLLLDAIPTSGSVLPYTVLDDTLKNGAKPGARLEIRNGGFGSAAAAHPTNPNWFYALTDRGPNAKYKKGDKKGKIFPIPNYTPRIGLFEIQSDGSIKMVKEILLKDRNGNNISGLPNPNFGATNEKPYDIKGKLITENNNKTPKTDPNGLDPEALVALKDGTFWISDEYGPHIVHFDANGIEIDRINPFIDDKRSSIKLPSEFSHRRPNRGMEGLAITPNQKILVGIMQSTMDNPKSARKSTLTRIVTIDLETKKIKQYLYKQDKPENSNSEIVAINDDEFLVIERDGKFGTKKGAQKYIYKIKLSSGTELEALDSSKNAAFAQDPNLGLTINGKTLEEVVYNNGNLSKGWKSLAEKGIYPVSKKLVVDMVAEFGYPHDKMEGLILFKDGSLGVLNDDDFAITVKNNLIEQKYLDNKKKRIDQNTLYIIKKPTLADRLVKLGAYKTGKKQGSEIVAYDKLSKRVFITNGADNRVDIIDITNPSSPRKISDIDLQSYGTGVNSVAAHSGLVAVAIEIKSKDGNHSRGKVVFFDTDGNFKKSVTVGYLPDMVTFSEDGSKVVVANEGEPNKNYSYDPIGSIGIIKLPDYSYVDIDFSNVNLTPTNGIPVRLGKTPSNNKVKDIEPEYISVSGNYAYVTLQENNAIAKVNLTTNKLEYVKSLGAKSYEPDSSNTIDIKEDGEIRMQSYKGLFGLYMPDTIASYTVGGKTYLVTANEGDSREYGDFEDEKKISKLKSKLDKSIKDAYSSDNDLKVIVDMGDEDSDGKYEKLYAFGTRSFSIWDTESNLIFDSGDTISKIVANAQPALFNQDKGKMDGRSGNKGSEPEALTIGEIDGRVYAFVGLERQSAIVMYDITDPKKVKFIDYIYTGDQGDIAPEGMKFIPASDSPNGNNLLLVAYEKSGSTAIYEVKR